SDSVHGGDGNDRVVLDGDYSSAITLAVGTLDSVERIQFDSNLNLNITTVDANVAASQSLVVDGSAIDSAHALTVDDSAESDDSFDLRGEAGNDHLTGSAESDIFRLDSGGNDTANGGDGDDLFKFGVGFTSADHVDDGN